MIEQKEQRMRAFVEQAIPHELKLLQWAGGKGLRDLAIGIYAGFGLYPGQDEKLADHLVKFPMVVRGTVPTFTWKRFTKEQHLLRPPKRAAEPILPFRMFAHDYSTLYKDRSVAKTRTIEWFMDGAVKLHEKVNTVESRGNLYLHILLISAWTAQRKGLTW